MSETGEKLFCLNVKLCIKPERREEFLDVMHKDAVGSRTEEECLRFDLLSDEKDPNKFYFYEYATRTCRAQSSCAQLPASCSFLQGI